MGMHAPIDVQMAGTDLKADYRDGAGSCRAQIREIPGVADVFIPQDLDYPALKLDIDRTARGGTGAELRRRWWRT